MTVTTITSKSAHFLIALAAGSILLLTPKPSEAEQPTITVRPVVDASIPAYAPKTAITGSIAIAGSDTMQPIVARVASAFKVWQPNVKIAVQGGGSDSALRAFIQNIAASRRGDGNVKGHLSANDVEILASSRPLTAEEKKEFRSRYGFEPTEIPIAMDAIVFYVNHQNPIERLTLEQLDAIFSTSRKRGAQAVISTWGQLGLADGWEQQPIRLYGRDKRSGTRNLFIHEVLLDGTMKSEVKEEPGTAMEILAISRDVLGIGYAGIGFQASTVRIVPIVSQPGEVAVFPTAETVANGSYPLSRPLYLYAKRNPKGELPPEISEFLRFINSRDGQETIAKAGVYPLSSQQVTANLQALVGGTTSSLSITASVQ
jgi:phosphate transport system substrate-binding protein